MKVENLSHFHISCWTSENITKIAQKIKKKKKLSKTTTTTKKDANWSRRGVMVYCYFHIVRSQRNQCCCFYKSKYWWKTVADAQRWGGGWARPHRKGREAVLQPPPGGLRAPVGGQKLLLCVCSAGGAAGLWADRCPFGIVPIGKTVLARSRPPTAVFKRKAFREA